MLKPIRSKREYEAALQQVYTLMQKDIKPGSKLADELEVLSILVEAYEKKLPCAAAETRNIKPEQLRCIGYIGHSHFTIWRQHFQTVTIRHGFISFLF